MSQEQEAKTSKRKVLRSAKANTGTSTKTANATSTKNKKNKNLIAFKKVLNEGKLDIHFLKSCSNCKRKFVTQNREAETCTDECLQDNRIRGGEKFVFYPPSNQIESNFDLHKYPKRNQKSILTGLQKQLNGETFTFELFHEELNKTLPITFDYNGKCKINLPSEELEKLQSEASQKKKTGFAIQRNTLLMFGNFPQSAELYIFADYSYELYYGFLDYENDTEVTEVLSPEETKQFFYDCATNSDFKSQTESYKEYIKKAYQIKLEDMRAEFENKQNYYEDELLQSSADQTSKMFSNLKGFLD